MIYLPFIVGLEIDLVEFARIRQRSFRFGLLTFSLPMAGGMLLGLGFGCSLLSSVLIGSILSSHTPLGYPIVRSYGAVREESVVVAIGGTIFTDIAALVVLALAVGLARGAMGPLGAVGLLLKVAAYAALVVVLIQRLGRPLVRRNVNNDSQLFVLVLLTVFLAALATELAGVEKIVGAFLAGLAVNGAGPGARPGPGGQRQPGPGAPLAHGAGALANPDSERPLLGLAQLLIGGDADHPGRVLPLAVVSPLQPELGGAGTAALTAQLGRGRQLLERTRQISQEQGSDLVLMGLAPPSRLGRWLFGDLVDATCRQVPCPVVVAHLVSEPSQWCRLLVPIKDLTAGAMEQFQLAERLAAALGASIKLLHLHDPRLAAGALADLQRDLERCRSAAAASGQGVAVTLDLQPSHGVEAAILRSSSHDLVILRSQRRLVAHEVGTAPDSAPSSGCVLLPG